MARKLAAPIPRFALTPAEAAASLGMGEDTFNKAVRPALRVCRVGRKVLIPVDELRRWLEDNAETAVAERVPR